MRFSLVEKSTQVILSADAPLYTIPDGWQSVVVSNPITDPDNGLSSDPMAVDGVVCVWGNLQGLTSVTVLASLEYSNVVAVDPAVGGTFDYYFIDPVTGETGSVGTLTVPGIATGVAPTMPADATASVSENTTAVGTYTATAGDTPITYSLSGADAALFAIDSSAGVVTFSSAPDYENPQDADTNNVYLITVTATNSEGSDSQNVSVTVADVDDGQEAVSIVSAELISSNTIALVMSDTISVGYDELYGMSIYSDRVNPSIAGYSVTPTGLLLTLDIDLSRQDILYIDYVQPGQGIRGSNLLWMSSVYDVPVVNNYGLLPSINPVIEISGDVYSAGLGEYISGAVQGFSGANVAFELSASGGLEFSVDNGITWITGGWVSPQLQLNWRVRAPNTINSSITARLENALSGQYDSFVVSTGAAPDVSPNAFTFSNVLSADAGVVIESNTVAITGINQDVTIRISSPNGAEYSADGGPYTAANGLVSNNSFVRLRAISSVVSNGSISATLSVGDYSTTWAVTTKLSNIGPVFEQSTVNIAVNERTVPGDVIGQVQASDANGDELIYSLQDDDGAFIIDSITGEIILNTTLKYAEKSQYTFKAMVSDGALSDISTVTVDVSRYTIPGPTVDALDAKVKVYPAGTWGFAGGVIYRGNTNVVAINDLKYLISREHVNNATVSINVYSQSGTLLAGSITAETIGNGKYYATIPHTLDLSAHDLVIVEVTASVGGSVGRWDQTVTVTNREN